MSVVDVRDTPPEISDEAWDLYLGAATRLLAENGDGRAAALLVDARLLQAIDSSSQLKFRGECAWDYGAEVSYMVILGAPKFLVDRYTRAVIEKIRGALNDVGSEKMNFYVDHLIVPSASASASASASEPVPPDWRFHLLQRLGSSPVNQATIGLRWNGSSRTGADSAAVPNYGFTGPSNVLVTSCPTRSLWA